MHPFHPRDIDKALAFANIPKDQQLRVKATLARLQKKVNIAPNYAISA
jgi:hypothetical protein